MEGKVDIFKSVNYLREQRVNMVQTPVNIEYLLSLHDICDLTSFFSEKATKACICSAQSENQDNSGIDLRKVRIPKFG